MSARITSAKIVDIWIDSATQRAAARSLARRIHRSGLFARRQFARARPFLDIVPRRILRIWACVRVWLRVPKKGRQPDLEQMKCKLSGARRRDSRNPLGRTGMERSWANSSGREAQRDTPAANVGVHSRFLVLSSTTGHLIVRWSQMWPDLRSNLNGERKRERAELVRPRNAPRKAR